MATLRNKRKLEAINRDNHEEHPRDKQARHTNVPRNQEGYFTQVSEEIEGTIAEKLSEESSRTESRFLSALSKLDEFLINPQARVHSGSIPETSRNSNRENLETNEDRPRMILILKWVSLWVSPHKNSAQTRLPTLTLKIFWFLAKNLQN